MRNELFLSIILSLFCSSGMHAAAAVAPFDSRIASFGQVTKRAIELPSSARKPDPSFLSAYMPSLGKLPGPIKDLIFNYGLEDYIKAFPITPLTLPITNFGCDSKIYSAAFNPSGPHLVTTVGTSRALICNIDLADGKRYEFNHDGSVISAAAFNRAGTHLATGAENGTVRIWNIARGTHQEFNHGAKITSITFNSTGTHMITCAGEIVRVWDIATGIHKELAHGSSINSININREGTHIVTGGSNGIVRVWDTEKRTHRDFDHGSPINSVAFNSSGTRIITTGAHGARIWDIATGEHKEFNYGSEITFACFNPTGNYIATGDLNGKVRVWNIDTGIHYELNHGARINFIAFNPANTKIITCGDNHIACIWDISHLIVEKIDEDIFALLLALHDESAKQNGKSIKIEDIKIKHSFNDARLRSTIAKIHPVIRSSLIKSYKISDMKKFLPFPNSQKYINTALGIMTIVFATCLIAYAT